MAKPEDYKVGSRWVDCDGDEHLIIHTEPGREEGEIATKWGPKGKLGWWYMEDGFFVREVKPKLVRYVNLYTKSGSVWPSVDEADAAAWKTRIARVRVEFEEGQFDD